MASCSSVDSGSEESVTITTFSDNDLPNTTALPVPVLSYAGNEYVLGTALQVRRANGRTHSHREIHFSDGSLSSSLVDLQGVEFELWSPIDASVWLKVELFAPLGATGFAGSYRSLSPDADTSDEALRETYYFLDARFGVDRNGDRAISAEAGELIDISFGSIDIVDEGERQRLLFILVLSDGISLTGDFTL